MEIKPINDEKSYQHSLDRLELIFDATKGTDEGDELEILSILIDKYENENFPIGMPDPIEAIKFRMEQMNLKQGDIAPLFGGKTRVSEVLHGKRSLTLKMITLLNRYLGIPLESLVAGNKEIKLAPENREKLLSIASIKEYFSGSRAAII